MGIACGSNPNPKLAGVLVTLIHRIRGVTRSGTTHTRQLPSAPRFERTETSGDETFARQCVLVGDSLNDEQWGDDLSKPLSY